MSSQGKQNKNKIKQFAAKGEHDLLANSFKK